MQGGLLRFADSCIMSRVYVGNLDPRATERELEDEFRVYGVLRRFVIVLISSHLILSTYLLTFVEYEMFYLFFVLKLLEGIVS